MTVTRQRLAAPPDPGDSAPPGGADAALDARLARDQLKVLQFFAGRAGQHLDISQTVQGTRLPAARALAAIDALVDAGALTSAGLRRTRFGHVRIWLRVDPPREAML